MGQGIKYGIAAAGTLLLLTVLSWNADEKKKKTSSESKTIVSGATMNTETSPVDEKYQSPTEPEAKTEPVAHESLLKSLKKAEKTSEAKDSEKKAPAPAPKTKPEPAPKPADTSNHWVKHSVKKNESLYGIAKHYLGAGEKWQVIVAANSHLSSPERLREGMTLRIPKNMTSTLAAAPKAKPTLRLGRPGIVRTPARRPNVANDEAGDHEHSKKAPTGTKSYVVRKGETLSSIALTQMGSKSHWKKLYNANRKTLANPNSL
ncbi:MAG: LysM peptidoglycan-binding domain-containing protein, partial [Planctomycetota bacterium]|nr:LysM peptidoglycan-binding domain-containing protein [Planctomycetota bacterium]